MAAELSRLTELQVYPSQANFLLVKLAAGLSGTELRDHLLAEHRVFVRECGNKLGMTSQYLRLVVRPAADVARLVAGIRRFSQHDRGPDRVLTLASLVSRNAS
jgi:histidinol-phosphate/aromatic aminotransferase/cobyric acid decarboxylase-like protein